MVKKNSIAEISWPKTVWLSKVNIVQFNDACRAVFHFLFFWFAARYFFNFNLTWHFLSPTVIHRIFWILTTSVEFIHLYIHSFVHSFVHLAGVIAMFLRHLINVSLNCAVWNPKKLTLRFFLFSLLNHRNQSYHWESRLSWHFSKSKMSIEKYVS